MFDTIKFGKALSTLRKEADMTQNEVADRLNLSRQAISKYERGESFPDISVLVMLAELFYIPLGQLIGYGNPTQGDYSVYENIARGNADISQIISLAEDNLAKMLPMLNSDSKEALLQKVLDGEMDWHFIKVLLPYAGYLAEQIEAAVVAGVLPGEVLNILNAYYLDRNGYC